MISSMSGFDRRFAEIKRHGVDRAGRIRNFRITLFAQDLIEGGIDRESAVPVFVQQLQGFIRVAVGLWRSAQDGDGFG